MTTYHLKLADDTTFYIENTRFWMKICACGCGEQFKVGSPRKYVQGHAPWHDPKLKACACGCGEMVYGRFKRNHFPRKIRRWTKPRPKTIRLCACGCGQPVSKGMKLIKGHRNFKQRNYKFYCELKRKPCLDCGRSFPPVCMDFDHRPGTVKSIDVARLVSQGPAIMLEEIEKCDLVCSNCHRIRTHQRRHGDQEGLIIGSCAGTP